jgi:putative transposase
VARALRIEAPGCWYHVTVRGNERRAVFRDDTDRRHFQELLGESVERFRLLIHAYVLMNNHYHLLLQTREANLSRAMQWLGVGYTVWFNRRHGRVGHLFQGRFGAVVLEETAAGEVSRYVHLNPVRVGALGLGKAARAGAAAGLAEAASPAVVRERIRRLRQYRWSSYRAYAGWESGPNWLTREAVLRSLAGAEARSQWALRYREFVEAALRDGLAESPWERLQGQVLGGGAEFMNRMRRLARGDAKEQAGLRALRARPTLDTVIAAVAEVRGERWEQWRERYGDWGREAVLWLGRKRCGLKLAELGSAIGGLDYRSVSSALRRFAKRLETDKKLVRQLKAADARIQQNEM